MILALDPHFLANNPDVLRCCGPSRSIVLTEDAYQRAMGTIDDKSRLVLEKATESGQVSLFLENSESQYKYLSSLITDRDKASFLMSVYKEGQRRQDEIVLLSFDSELIDLAEKFRVKTLRGRDFLQAFLYYKPRRRTRFHNVLDDIFSIFRASAIGFGVASALLGIIYIVWIFRQQISQTIPTGVLVLLGSSLGFGLFWFRSRFRFSYGVVEIIFGVLNSTRFPPLSQFNWGLLLQFATGIYVIVRGLDNIDKGMRKSDFSHEWESVFGSNIEK